MALRDFKSHGAEDAINKIQDNIDVALRPVLACPLIDGVLIQDIQLASGNNTIEHKLGRELRGYIIVKKSSNVNIYDVATTLKTRNLILNSSGTATISLWCF